MYEPNLLTIDEAAEMLRVGKSTVWKLIQLDGLPTIKIGKRRLVPRKALNEWVEKRTMDNEPVEKSDGTE